MRDGLRRHQDPRAQGCGRRLITTGGVQIHCRDCGAHYNGVMRCGLPSVCPACGLLRAAHDAEEIGHAVQAWGPGRCVMVTFTMKHSVADSLAESHDTLMRAQRRLRAGRAYQRLKARYGIEHAIQNMEVTHGEHGWHPHRHGILLLREPLSAEQVEQLDAELSALWQRAVRKEGAYTHVPSQQIGCKVTPLHLARYLAKLGLELAATLTKSARTGGSRTIWQVAADLIEHGDRADLALWHEYRDAIRGRHLLQWSAGLRDAVGLGVERTDQEVVDGEAGDEVCVAVIDRQDWRRVIEVPDLPVALLEAAERGGFVAVDELLRERVGARARPPPGAACEDDWLPSSLAEVSAA